MASFSTSVHLTLPNPTNRNKWVMTSGSLGDIQELRFTEDQLKQIIALHVGGVFKHMSENAIAKKEIDISTTMASSPHDPECSDRESSSTGSSGGSSVSVGGSSTNAGSSVSTGSSNQLWHTYVKIVKGQNPLLSHAEAVQKAKLTYQDWKKTQA